MEIILLVLNAANMQLPAVNFASYLSDLTQSKLTALFLKNSATEPKQTAETAGTEFFGEEEDYYATTLVNSKLIKRNIFFFE